MENLKCDKWENKKLIAMVGLPYSGKSTIAKGMGYPIVCPDAIRVAIHGARFIPSAEGLVWAIAKIMVHSLFLSGHDVVVLDATNTTKDRRDEWVSSKYTTQWNHINTPKEECISRAKNAGDEVIIPIIEKMAEQFEDPECCECG